MVILVGFDDGEMRFNVDFMGFQWDLIIVVIYGVSRIRGYIYIRATPGFCPGVAA